MCNGLSKKSQLFSTCIQAHSAANLVDHLISVGASATAIDTAKASLAEAIVAYAALGGGAVPGFMPKVGDPGPGGGIIFYLYPSTANGLEAARVDQFAVWGCIGTSITEADGTAIGTGQDNTDAIVLDCDEFDIAARVASEYVWPNGQSDGFLPSKDELNLMFNSIGPGAPSPLTNVGGFASASYWSSTEANSYNAWFQVFVRGLQDVSYKNDAVVRVRAVRAF